MQFKQELIIGLDMSSEEISIEYGGKQYVAEYVVCDGVLTVFLPNGTTKSTVLEKLNPKTSAMIHLKSYIRLNVQ